jgi:hypothetical protein
MAVVATVLGTIPASSDTVESEAVLNIVQKKKKNPKKSPFKHFIARKRQSAAMEPSALLSIYVPNLPRILSRCNDVYEGLSQHGGRLENAKISSSNPLITN